MIDPSLREALSHLPRMVVFAELARQGSFRATAGAMGLSPSTVTHHLQALEELLDVRLVERTSRRMTLTSAGEALLEDANAVLAAWRRGANSARLFAAAPTGHLVVTAPDVVAERFVVPAVQRLLDENPGVSLQLRVDSANLDLVAEGIDVAIRIGPLADSGYGVRLLSRDEHGIFAHPRLAASWGAQHPVELEPAPWVQFAVRASEPELVGPNGTSHTLRTRPRAWASSPGAYLALLASGVGFGLVPTGLVAPLCAAGELVRVLPRWSPGRAHFYAITPSPHPTDAKVVRFLEVLGEHFAAGPTRSRLA